MVCDKRDRNSRTNRTSTLICLSRDGGKGGRAITASNSDLPSLLIHRISIAESRLFNSPATNQATKDAIDNKTTASPTALVHCYRQAAEECRRWGRAGSRESRRWGRAGQRGGQAAGKQLWQQQRNRRQQRQHCSCSSSRERSSSRSSSCISSGTLQQRDNKGL